MRITWTTKAVKDMRRLTIQDRERVVSKIEQYAADQASLANQVSMLTGSPHRRMRVGNYRVIFTVESHRIAVTCISHHAARRSG